MNSPARARSREPGGNLPVDVTSFVGRRREITLTKRLLGESRLVTLTGPGGIGKSRLALRVAGSMRRVFRDKVWQVELGELEDPSLIPATVIDALDIGDTSTDDELDDLVEHLRNRELLLILDNCEHLVQECAMLAETLIRSCPGVRILATSRQSLGVAGESTLAVPPLQMPDLDDLPVAEALEQYASVRLFIDRARAVLPEFEPGADEAGVIMRLCHRLDGNPLAIELAVVRLRSLSLHQLEQRLSERYELLTQGRRGAPARQQTLRALIDWSYDLCTEPERRAWAHLSVFSGDFDLEAAEYVIDGRTGSPAVASLVHALVDKSVLLSDVDSTDGRYRLPHALREYGLEKLSNAGDRDAAEVRHRDWYAGVAERFAAEWIGPDQVAWIERLRRDQTNIRAALQAAVAGSRAVLRPSTALRMATRMSRYWGIRGLSAEARHWLDRALSAESAPTRDRAAALRASAWFALLQGDIIGATPLLDEAESLTDQHGDPVEQAYLTHTRGMASLFQGQLGKAETAMTTALSTFQAHGATDGWLSAQFGLGVARGLGGDHSGGLSLLEDCLDVARGAGDVFWRSYALWAIAYVEVAHDSTDRADSATKEALRLQRRMDNRLATAFSLDTLAWVAQRQGRDRRSATLFGAAFSVWETIRSSPTFYATFGTEHRKHEEQARTSLGEEAFAESFDQGYDWPVGTALDYALEVKKRSRETTKDNVHPMPLTRREREIAHLVAQGRTNKEIAENLVIALRTVEGHVQHILTKLDFTSRAQIAGWVAGQTSDTAE